MTELEERLRRFAEEGASQAHPPGVAAAIRRGRLRRRRLVGAASRSATSSSARVLPLGPTRPSRRTPASDPNPRARHDLVALRQRGSTPPSSAIGPPGPATSRLILQPHPDGVGSLPAGWDGAAGQGAPWTAEQEVVAMGLTHWWKTGAAPNDYEFGLAEETFQG